MPRLLPLPDTIAGDEQATEMIRAWLAHGDLQVSLLLGMWADAEDSGVDEPEAWGHLLADIARHVANGLQDSHEQPAVDTLRRIRESFVASVEHQEGRIEGRYVDN